MVSISNDNELDKILKEKFTSVFRKGYVNYNGFTMPERYLEMADEIDNFEINDEDIWICSFPKTGTTWTQEMVWMIVNNLDFKGGEVSLYVRSPYLEFSAYSDDRDIAKNNKDFKTFPFLKDSLAFVKSQKHPLCIKTHLPWPLLPKQIQNGAKKPKIIYVTRNPKDTCVSYYHYSRLLEGYVGNFDEFCQLFLAGKITYGPYWKHVLPFWNKRNSENVLFLKYEDMKTDLPKIIRKVAAFLERSLSEEQIEILTKHLSFESMKRNKSVNYEMTTKWIQTYNLSQYEGAFMRSGTVGDYKVAMSQDVIDKFNQWEQENLKFTDYTCL